MESIQKQLAEQSSFITELTERDEKFQKDADLGFVTKQLQEAAGMLAKTRDLKFADLTDLHRAVREVDSRWKAVRERGLEGATAGKADRLAGALLGSVESEWVRQFFALGVDEQANLLQGTGMPEQLVAAVVVAGKDLANSFWEVLSRLSSSRPSKATQDAILSVFSQLLIHDVNTDQLLYQARLIEWIVSKIQERGFAGEYDEVCVQRLMDKRLLLLVRHRWGNLLVRTLLSEKKIPSAVLENIKVLSSEEKLSDIDALYGIFERFPWAEFRERAEHMRHLEATLGKYEGDDPTLATLMRIGIGKVAATHRETERECKQAAQLLMAGKTVKVPPDFTAYCIQEGLWQCLTVQTGSEYSPVVFSSKLFLGLFLDKLVVPEERELKGFDPRFPAGALLRSLQRSAEILVKDATLAEVFGSVDHRLRPLLKEFIGLYTSGLSAHNLVLARMLKMKVGEELLVPTGCSGHATLLLVQKSDGEHFRLIHYNTGGGVAKWHPQWKGTHKYQTFLIIDGVPAESVLDETNLSKLLLSARTASSMDPVYGHLINGLGKGGVVLEGSNVESDYQSKQASGTCATQCLIALLRHLAMQMAAGSPEEKEAVYKIIRNRIFDVWRTDQVPENLKMVARHVPFVINKLGAQFTLYKAADKKEDFQRTLNQVCDRLEMCKQHQVADRLLKNPSDTTFQRYATLRGASAILYGLWDSGVEVPLDKEDESPVLQFALLKFEAANMTRKNLRVRLDEALEEHNENDWTKELYRTVLATPHLDWGIEQCVSDLKGETWATEPGRVVLLDRLLEVLNGYRRASQPVVRKLVTQLHTAKLDAEAVHVEKRWRDLKPTASNIIFD
jgi:hypothetical protein